VGRLGDQRLSVIGTGTASEWQHIFRGASFVTGVESRNIPEAMQASDQVSFVRNGVPAVQIFTGAHGDYHRPGDTADKIDGPGLVKVATFVREGVTYLAERPEPLTNTIAPATRPASGGPPPPPQAASARRVSFGTVPDFAFEGPGVRVGGLVDGSPAQKADIREGDVITAIDGKPVANLQAFSAMLGSFVPGQTVKATVLRAGKELTVTVTLAER
jgi:membrane-associated protease RseP (regulator of RpoE activity)